MPHTSRPLVFLFEILVPVNLNVIRYVPWIFSPVSIDDYRIEILDGGTPFFKIMWDVC